MALIVYAATALALLALIHRLVRPLSRGAGLFLFFLPFVFTGWALVTNRVYAPIDRTFETPPLSALRAQYGMGEGHNPATSDVYAQFIPWRHVLRESVRRGQWPLWNPYLLSGDILAATSQPAVYSPFTWIALLLPPALSFTFSASIAFFLAGAGAFAFARAHGCRELTAAIAAAGFACSTSFALYVLWPFGLCWALLPWTLLATHRCILAPGLRSWALLTTILALLVLGGHPESAMHVVFLGALYGLFQLARTRREVGRVLATVFAAGGVALLLSAIALLPLLEAIPQTIEYPWRQFLKTLQPNTPGAEVLVKLGHDFFPFLHLRRWIDPAIPTLQGETAAVGSIVLALAVYAIWRVRSAAAWFFAALAALGIAVQASWPPALWLMKRLPLFDIALNERLAFGSAFFLALLAALGAEEAIRRSDRRGLLLTFLATLVLLGAGTWGIARSVTLGPAPWGEHKIFAELALLAVAALLLLAPMRVAAPALLAVILLQRGLSEGGVHRSFPARAAYPPVPALEPLRHAQGPFRVAGLGWSLVPNMSAMYGLEDVRGYEAMTFRPYADTYRLWSVPQPVFFNRIDDLAKPILSMMNVRFAVVPPDAATPPGWQRVNAMLVENPHALDRAFIPPVVRLGLPNDKVVNEMATEADFRQLAWISADEVTTPYQRPNGPGRVTRLRRTPAHGYELDVAMERDGWVLVTESAWKGWRAYLDGRRVKTQRGNVAFLAVYIPPGRHHLRLVYWPESFVVGRWVTFGTLVLIALFLIVSSLRRRRRA